MYQTCAEIDAAPAPVPEPPKDLAWLWVLAIVAATVAIFELWATKHHKKRISNGTQDYGGRSWWRRALVMLGAFLFAWHMGIGGPFSISGKMSPHRSSPPAARRHH